MKIPKITSVAEILDLNKEKKRNREKPEQKSSKMIRYIVASASALLPEKYAFTLTGKILKNTRRSGLKLK